MTVTDWLSIIAGIVSAGSLYITRRNDRDRDSQRQEMLSIRTRVDKLERDYTGIAAVMGEIRDDVKEIRYRLFGTGPT